MKDPVRAAWAAVAAYAAFSLLVPVIPVPRQMGLIAAGVLTLLTTALFMGLQLRLSSALVGLRPRAKVCAGAMAASALAWALTLAFIAPRRGMPRWEAVGVYHLRTLLIGLTVTLACSFLGILLSRIIREINVLLPVALVAMPIDYIGAMTPIGFTQNAVKQHPSVVQAVSVPVPAAGGLHPIGFIGPGDALFMAFFFAVVLRLGLNVRGTFLWMYALLTLTMGIVLIVGWDIAALIPMGLAVLIANGRSFRLQRSEVFATLYAFLLILALVTAFFLYSHTHFFRH